MYPCENCGAEITFRYIGGTVRPICPNGCNGGDGPQSKVQELRFEHERDLRRPTRCPKCPAYVYFIRHNGGSVWVDRLGWPWPKHPCFDSAPDETASLQTLADKALQFQAVAGAVVTRVAFISGVPECLAVVRKPGAEPETWLVSGVENPQKLLGALVAVSAVDRKLVLAGVGVYDISEPKPFCRVCGAEVKESGFDRHMEDHHGAQRCTTCHAFVSQRELGAHMREHQRESQLRQDKRRPARARTRVPQIGSEPVRSPIEGECCPEGHGPLRLWEGTPRCWTCGWPYR